MFCKITNNNAVKQFMNVTTRQKNSSETTENDRISTIKSKNKDEIQSIINTQLDSFFEQYESEKKAIPANFRKLVSWVPYSESLTHYIHQYPAKLLKHIPIFFLNSRLVTKEGMVLDPFCGSGTVLLESIVAGKNAIGCDANPIARLIAEVKTTPLSASELSPYVLSVVRRAKSYRKYDLPNVVNINHWFPEHTQKSLSRLYRAINEVENEKHRKFLLVTFSNIIKKVSFCDPNLSVPVKLKAEKYTCPTYKSNIQSRINKIDSIEPFEVFESELKQNILRMERLSELSIKNEAKIISVDARKITRSIDSSHMLPDGSVDTIITSPPYAGAQKYIRASSLSLGWLDYCEKSTLRDFEKKNIGREHYSKSEYESLPKLGISAADTVLEKIGKKNKLRAYISFNYLLEMTEAIKECYRVLRNQGYCVIVIGNNKVCGYDFKSSKYLKDIAESAGFSTKLVLIDDIHSRGLMTKRNKTASIINSEWILVLQKNE